MILTKNFKLKELTYSQTAERLSIDQDPSKEQIALLTNLCCMILQPVRDHFGKVVTVSSGYRHPDLCVALGSKPTSEHTCQTSAAADFELFGVDNLKVAEWIRDNLEFSTLILEYYSPPNGGWIHCSYSPTNNAKKVLRAVKVDGKTKYEPGLCP